MYVKLFARIFMPIWVFVCVCVLVCLRVCVRYIACRYIRVFGSVDRNSMAVMMMTTMLRRTIVSERLCSMCVTCVTCELRRGGV